MDNEHLNGGVCHWCEISGGCHDVSDHGMSSSIKGRQKLVTNFQ